MPRGVEQVNQAVVIRKLHHRRGNGDPTLLFHLHPVRLSVLVRATAFYCTGGLNGLSEQQHLLGDGSLTGVRVRNNGKSAALRHLLQIRRQRHNSFFLSKRHRAALVENEKLRLFYPSTGGRQSVFTQELLQFVQRRNGPGGRDAFWLLAMVRIQPAGRKPGVDATENIGLGSVANHQHA